MATSQVMQMLVGKTAKGKFPAVQGSELSVNMFRGDNGGKAFMESIHGIRKLMYLGGKCRGTYVSTRGLDSEHSPEDMFAVMGNVVWRLKENEKTKLFTVASGGRRVCFAETGGPTPIMLVADGVNLHSYNLLTGEHRYVQLPVSVEGEGHVVKPTHCCVIDGCIVINDQSSGYCYYSNRYALSAPTREVFDLDNGQVQYEPDGITVKMKTVDSWDWCFYDDYHTQMFFLSTASSDCVNGLISVGSYLYVFGPKSVEVKTYQGGEYATWSDLYFSAHNSFGLEAPDSLCQVGNTVFFISTGQARGKCVMAATATNFEPVSDSWLDELLESENTDSAYSFAYAESHHQFVVLQLGTLGQTWCYDLASKEWHSRTSRDRNTTLEMQWRVGGIAYWHQKFYCFTNDGLFAAHDGFVEEYNTGSPLPVIRHRQGPVFVSDNRPFVIEELALECNSGCTPDYREDPDVLLELSKDGGMTWGNVRAAKFGRTGQYSHRVRWHALGMVRLAVVRITFSEPMDFVLTDCDVRAAKTGAMM